MIKKYCTLCILLTVILSVFCYTQCSKTHSVTEYGVFAPSRLSFVNGQDGCTPIDFDHRYTLWTFGDTITDEGMISNSLAFTEKINATNVTQLQFEYYREHGKIAQFIKNTYGENPSRDRLWAFNGIRVGNMVYVYYAHVYIHDPAKPLSFTMKESSIAYWNVPKQWEIGKPIHFIRKKNMFVGNVPALGASVMMHNNYVYVVGHIGGENKSSLVIARVHKDNILRQNHYEFLQGDSNWDKKFNLAKRLYDDVAGECSLTYNVIKRSYNIVYCQLFTGNIVMCKAQTIELLPQAKKEIIYTPPRLRGTAMMYYSAKAILHEEKQWYIVYMNPLEYQPFLVKVMLH